MLTKPQLLPSALATDAPKDIRVGYRKSGALLMPRTVGRTEYVFAPVSERMLVEQQCVADRCHHAGLLSHPIKVTDIVWA